MHTILESWRFSPSRRVKYLYVIGGLLFILLGIPTRWYLIVCKRNLKLHELLRLKVNLLSLLILSMLFNLYILMLFYVKNLFHAWLIIFSLCHYLWVVISYETLDVHCGGFTLFISLLLEENNDTLIDWHKFVKREKQIVKLAYFFPKIIH